MHSRQVLQIGDKNKMSERHRSSLNAGWWFVCHSLQNFVYSVVFDDNCKEGEKYVNRCCEMEKPDRYYQHATHLLTNSRRLYDNELWRAKLLGSYVHLNSKCYRRQCCSTLCTLLRRDMLRKFLTHNSITHAVIVLYAGIWLSELRVNTRIHCCYFKLVNAK